jgi:hypothetical protein
MRQVIRVVTVLAVLTTFLRILPPAMAATPEGAYLAARDAAIAKIKAMDAANQKAKSSDDSAILDLDKKAEADLEKQMRGIVGPVAIKGLEGDGALNLDSLITGDEDFGLLDGMVYGPLDGKTRVIVTTDGLLRRWLFAHKSWWGKGFVDMPQFPQAAVRADAFYTQAVLNDAAIMRFAELPVHKPQGAAFAFAMLAARSQSDVPAKADEIFVVTEQGGRVFIANTKEIDTVGPISECDKIRSDLVDKSTAAASEPGLNDAARQKKSEALSGKSDTEFLRCFAEKASKQDNFAAAVTAAQALIDRLPLH